MIRQASLLLLAVSVLACRPSVDRADSQESLAAGGATEAGTERRNGNPVAKGAEKATPETLPTNAIVAPAPDETAPLNEAEDDSGNSPPTDFIPAQYRGRWGMVAADCEPGRSDAKGLLTIDAGTLRFYESRGSLQEQRPAIATSFSGVFSFTGEGQAWERVVTLTREGNKLTRADAEGRYTYTRC